HRWNICSAVYNPPRYYRRPSPPPHPPAPGGGGHHGGSGGSTGGGGSPVVVVGKGPYHGGPPDPRLLKDNDGNPHLHGAGGVAHVPAVLGPGVDSGNNVVQELR